jgi:hypothetical protein
VLFYRPALWPLFTRNNRRAYLWSGSGKMARGKPRYGHSFREHNRRVYLWGGSGKMARGNRIDREAKRRQAAKLAEIRQALVAAGCNTAAKQAAALGVSRPTAWVVLNRDKRAGPSSVIIRRMLSSPNVPPTARRKIEEYVDEKVAGLYGHAPSSRRWFRDHVRDQVNRINAHQRPN